jgi:hypothetical protein
MMQDNQGAMPTLAASGPIMSGTGIPHELENMPRPEENFDCPQSQLYRPWQGCFGFYIVTEHLIAIPSLKRSASQ